MVGSAWVDSADTMQIGLEDPCSVVHISYSVYNEMCAWISAVRPCAERLIFTSSCGAHMCGRMFAEGCLCARGNVTDRGGGGGSEGAGGGGAHHSSALPSKKHRAMSAVLHSLLRHYRHYAQG